MADHVVAYHYGKPYTPMHPIFHVTKRERADFDKELTSVKLRVAKHKFIVNKQKKIKNKKALVKEMEKIISDFARKEGFDELPRDEFKKYKKKVQKLQKLMINLMDPEKKYFYLLDKMQEMVMELAKENNDNVDGSEVIALGKRLLRLHEQIIDTKYDTNIKFVKAIVDIFEAKKNKKKPFHR